MNIKLDKRREFDILYSVILCRRICNAIIIIQKAKGVQDMSLLELIESNEKEIYGSRTKNRLTVQISYAIQLIMDFFSADYIVLMDYIEDVSVICDPAEPTKIHLYQIKTKSAGKTIKLTTVIAEKWFEKLYANAMKYGEYVGTASLVCNADVEASEKPIFHNDLTNLSDPAVQKNIAKIQNAIATDQGIPPADVDLSKFFFIRTQLSTKGHKDEIEHSFSNFLFSQTPDLQVATVKAIYQLLYSELDARFNCEIDEKCTSVNEIFEKKGLTSTKVKEMISTGLNVQLPDLDKLFSEFKIVSISERRNLAASKSQLKMDMCSNLSVFVELKRIIYHLISAINESGVDSMPDLYKAVYNAAAVSDDISSIFKNEYYLKLLIMNMIYKYSNGGDL